MGMLASMFFARLITLPFTLLIIFLSKRLHGVYFIVGTLALYMFFFQLALNREAVT
jgi:ABC-type branched-subunit amino acid transport system permease subunit